MQGKFPHCAQQYAKILQAEQIQPEIQIQLGQPPSLKSTPWNWSETKTSGDVIKEEDSTEALLDQEQPPYHNSNPTNDISGINPPPR